MGGLSKTTILGLSGCGLAITLAACSGSGPSGGEEVAEPAQAEAAGALEPPRTEDTKAPVRVEPESPPEPARPEVAPELASELAADFLGSPLVPRKVEPGRYGSIGSFRQHRFITMERTTSSGVHGEAVLSIRREGTVYGCFLVETEDRSSSSKYANRDGVARSSENRGGRLVGARGRWTAQTGTVRVELDQFEYQSCAVGPDVEAVPEPTRLDCLGFGPTDRIKGPWMACRVEDERAPMAQMGLLLADSPRAGAWALRHDPSGRGDVQPPEDAHPWLLFATPAIDVDIDDRDRGGMGIELKISDRELDESRWKPPVYESKRTPEPEPQPPLDLD